MQQRFLLQILLLAQHVSGTTMPITRSSRVLYGGCCLWYLLLWFSSCWSGVQLRVMCPVRRILLSTNEPLRHNNIPAAASGHILERTHGRCDTEPPYQTMQEPRASQDPY